MQHLDVELGRDEPEAYIARDRRRALATRTEMPDRVRGAALFADVSGFTPLTDALANELGSQRGAEELTANLGRVFHAVIEELDRHGGDVIYFSGDAITCWLDGDDGLRATAAALAMQDAMARVGTIRTPAGTTVQLALKVAVAAGDARRFVVGDPEIQLIDVLAGALIDDLAETEHYAEKGEVVLDPSAVAGLGDRVRISAWRDATERRSPVRGRRVARRRCPDATRSRSRRRLMTNSCDRGCSPRCGTGCAPAGASSWPIFGRPSRCSCASGASTTTMTKTPSRSSTNSSGTRSGSWPASAGTSCS